MVGGTHITHEVVTYCLRSEYIHLDWLDRFALSLSLYLSLSGHMFIRSPVFGIRCQPISSWSIQCQRRSNIYIYIFFLHTGGFPGQECVLHNFWLLIQLLVGSQPSLQSDDQMGAAEPEPTALTSRGLYFSAGFGPLDRTDGRASDFFKGLKGPELFFFK